MSYASNSIFQDKSCITVSKKLYQQRYAGTNGTHSQAANYNDMTACCKSKSSRQLRFGPIPGISYRIESQKSVNGIGWSSAYDLRPYWGMTQALMSGSHEKPYKADAAINGSILGAQYQFLFPPVSGEGGLWQRSD